MGSTLLQNPPLRVDCSPKGHTSCMEPVTFGGMETGQGVWSTRACQRFCIRLFRVQFCPWALPYSWYSLRKSNWQTARVGERKAIALSELLVHSKVGSLQVLWQSRENKWNSKNSFNLENNPFDPFLSSRYLPHSCHSLHPMEHEFYEDNEYLSSLPADADRTEDFEYEVRSFSHHFTFLHEVMVEGFCITKKKLLYYREKYFLLHIEGKFF